jgi:hypothetical protein
VVRLVAVVEETLVARLSAGLRTLVLQRDRVDVTYLERPAGQQRQHGGVLDDLAQDAGTAFGGFIEEEFLTILCRGHRLAAEFARFELEVFLDGLLDGSLKACHLRA